MKIRLFPIVLAASVLVLSSCAWFRGPQGPQPSPLPQVNSEADIKQAWQASIGTTNETLLRPAVFEDSVFAAARDGTIIRLDGRGHEVWRIRSVPKLTGGVAVGGSLVVVGSSEGVLAAHDINTGALRWQVKTTGELGGTAFASDTIVVARIGDSQLTAYAAADGKQVWNYQRAQSSLSLHAYSGIVRVGDVILAGFPGGKMVALTLATGFPRWESAIAIPRGSNELERMADVGGDPVVQGDSICVAAFQGRIACVEREKGSLQWTRDYSSALGVVIQGKQIVFTDAAGKIYALDPLTGATIWKQDMLAYRDVGRPVFVSGAIAVADRQGWVHLLSPEDGHFIAQVRADRSGVMAPMLALSNGLLIAQAVDGTVVAFSVHY